MMNQMMSQTMSQMLRRSRRALIAVLTVVGLCGGWPDAVEAKPPPITMDVAGTYDSHGDVRVQTWRQQRRVAVRTVGFSGNGTVSCTNQACVERGLDGTIVRSTRDLEIRLGFKGSDEELAVVGHSRGNAVFTDGFESGDVTRVRGTATCTALAAGGRVCDLELSLSGRLRGAEVSGRIDLTMTGRLTLTGETGSWGTVDWAGSVG